MEKRRNGETWGEEEGTEMEKEDSAGERGGDETPETPETPF